MSNYNVLMSLSAEMSRIEGYHAHSQPHDYDAQSKCLSELIEVVRILVSEVKGDSV
jgi:hypothetical protein